MRKGGADIITRRLAIGMWNDAKFRKLSPQPPSGQGLWQWLLTGPKTNIVPGLLVVDEWTIAGALRWPLEATRECLKEIEDAGMASVDREAGLVWIPNAVHYNPPGNPNVVTAWVRKLVSGEFPECELFNVALAYIDNYLASEKGDAFVKAFREGLSESFREAFPEEFEEPFPKSGSRHQGSGIRDQDAGLPAADEPEPEGELDELAVAFVAAWNENRGDLPQAGPLEGAAFRDFCARVIVSPTRRSAEWWRVQIAERAGRAKFLPAKKGGPATAAWLLEKEERVAKLIAGEYDVKSSPKSENKTETPSTGSVADRARQRQLDASKKRELEAIERGKASARDPPEEVREAIKRIRSKASPFCRRRRRRWDTRQRTFDFDFTD